jgi:short-subunit dehydrogenase
VKEQTSRTALITGASSGIGAAFARRLARQRYQLILVARREAKLQELAVELQQQYGATVEVLPADLSELEGIRRVEQRIAAAGALDLLINNAGFGSYGHFTDVSADRHEDMINVHVTTSIRLCRAALPLMLKRGRGGIINVASVAAFFPLSGNSTYAASKAYLVTFSEALQREVAGSGVKIQALCPGFTITEFHETPEYAGFNRSEVPKALWMCSDDVVSASLRSLRRNHVICIPGWKYQWLVRMGQNRAMASLLSVLRRRQRS